MSLWIAADSEYSILTAESIKTHPMVHRINGHGSVVETTSPAHVPSFLEALISNEATLSGPSVDPPRKPA